MPKFKVRFTVEENFEEIVDADNKEDAADIATRSHECEGVFIDIRDIEKLG